MTDVASAFLARSVECLRDEYLPRLVTAVDALPEDDLWWRPHAGSNSVGNLLCHLQGNVFQWICAGLGDAPDHRDRAAEFARTGGGTRAELRDALAATVHAACAVVEGLDAGRLTEATTIQGFQVTALSAVYHVVEHFGWHTGQIVYIAKLRAGEAHGIAFYDDETINRQRNAQE